MREGRGSKIITRTAASNMLIWTRPFAKVTQHLYFTSILSQNYLYISDFFFLLLHKIKIHNAFSYWLQKMHSFSQTALLISKLDSFCGAFSFYRAKSRTFQSGPTWLIFLISATVTERVIKWRQTKGFSAIDHLG